MKKSSFSRSAFSNPRVLIGFVLCSVGVLLALAALGKPVTGTPAAPGAANPTSLINQPPDETQTWIQLTPTGGPPSRRELLAAVYDAANNRMIIHGGGNGSAELSDAWVLTNADGTEDGSPTWTRLHPATALSRSAHTAVYDSSSNRMIVFGGFLNGSFFNDVWVLTNANGTGGNPEWIQLAPLGGPPAERFTHTAVYDPATNRMTMFGGGNSINGFNDVWVLTNANGTEQQLPSWIQLFPTGTLPLARGQHSAVYDADTNRMVVFGGGGVDLFNDVWVLTSANGLGGNPEWIELAPDGSPPDARYGHVAGYDPTTKRMVVFGGTNNTVTFNDSWVLTNADNSGTDTPTWIHLAPAGTLPATRSQLGATYSVSSNRLSIFAGDNAPVCCNLLNDVWVLTGANGMSPAVSLSQTSLVFGTQLVGTTSEPQSVELTNTGTTTLTISSIAVSGDFIAENNCGSSVPAGASCTIRVAFSPSDKGVRSGAVTITDDAANSPQTIALTGTGTVVQLSPMNLNFGNQRVGTISPPHTVTLTNTGSTPLNIQGIGIVGNNFGDFIETTTCGSIVPAHSSCEIDVRFAPADTGRRAASIRVRDDGGGGTQGVKLMGTGIP
jgi:Abnormal spindle-like microcephaly-assoc'd, ASPM-SPD-2-Hydin/Galactose oxidase, central domain/Kelch motif